MFRLIDVFWAFITIAILILVGRFIRQRIGLLRSLYIPSSVVAGVVGLLLGAGALGAIVQAFTSPDSPLANGIFPETIRIVRSQSPSIFINIVFATIFLGQSVPGVREIWRQASPQMAFGQTLAWGQYVVGLVLTMAVLTPVFGLPSIATCLIEVAFEGGHGTAAGMAKTFSQLDFAAGADLSLALATVGLVTGAIAGTWLMDWARRKGQIQIDRSLTEAVAEIESERLTESPAVTAARDDSLRDLLIDPLSLNFGFVGLAIAFGWVILEALRWFEAVTWGRTLALPLCPSYPSYCLECLRL